MRIFSRVVWLFMFCLLLLFTFVMGLGAWRAYSSKKWPTTEGVVVAIYQNPNYKYLVGGKIYTNSIVSCNEFFNDYIAIWNSARDAEKYPLQSKVLVHYCPKKPTLAVLETVFDSNILIAVTVAAIFTGLCFAGFLFGWPMRLRWRFYWGDSLEA